MKPVPVPKTRKDVGQVWEYYFPVSLNKIHQTVGSPSVKSLYSAEDLHKYVQESVLRDPWFPLIPLSIVWNGFKYWSIFVKSTFLFFFKGMFSYKKYISI